MKSIENHSKNTAELLEQLIEVNVDTQVASFINKYKTWDSFFNQIINNSNDSNFPKIYSLVLTHKIVILCGLAESLGSGKGEMEKVRNFLDQLDINEKLLFSLMFGIKKSDVEAQQLYEESLKTGKDNTKKLLLSWENTQDFYHNEIKSIMLSFIKDSYDPVQKFFIERVQFFYGIRSNIVHQGTPNIINSMHLNKGATIMYMGNRDNKFFTIRYPIEEFFLRAALRLIGAKPKELNMSDFLWDEFGSEHALLVARICNKIKGC